MKYADYKIENLVFLKGTDGWSIDEKKEFLETCPENSGLEKTIEDLKELKVALEDGTVKHNQYGEINKNSLKAYITKHETNILYGRPWKKYYFCDDSKDFYILVDGGYSTFSRDYQVENLIEKYTDEKNIEKRFETLASFYKDKEDKWSKTIESDRYKATHAEQIKANKRLDALLDSFIVEVPVSVEKRDVTYTDSYDVTKSELRLTRYWYNHNEYGEILINRTPLSEDQADKLADMILELSKKVSDIMDEYRANIDEIMGKKGA